jgi:hypothetical protein
VCLLPERINLHTETWNTIFSSFRTKSEHKNIWYGKRKVVPVLNYAPRNDVWRNGDTAPLILNLDARWRWVVRFTLGKLYPRGKSPRYRGWLGPRSVLHSVVKRKIPARARNRIPCRAARNLVTILTELSCLAAAVCSCGSVGMCKIKWSRSCEQALLHRCV